MMNRYLLEVLILLQGIVIGAIFFCLFTQFPESPEELLRLDLITLLVIFGILACLAARLEWGARLLYQRRASNIIESRRRLQRCHRALQQLTRSHALNAERTQDALLELCQMAVTTLEVDSVSLWMLDHKRSQFDRVMAYDRLSGFSATVLSAPAILNSRYLMELANNRVISIEHAVSDERSQHFSSVRVQGARSVMDAPIYLDGQLAGVLCHVQRSSVRSFTSDEESFAASLADFAALVLERQKRKRTEDELRRRSLVIESALDGMAILDKNERFVYLNDAYLRVHGYSSTSDLIGQHWSMVYGEGERSRLSNDLMPLLQKRGRLCVEALGTRKSGTVFPQELSLTTIPDDGFICTVRDISGRKAVERRLIESKHFLRTVIDATPHLIFVKDRTGRFTLVNQAVADIYGTSVEKLVGKRDRDFNPKKDELDKFYSDDLRVIDTGEELFISEEVVTDAAGVEHVFQTIKRPLQDSPNGEIHVLGVATEVTQMKTLYQQLVQSQKMEAIGQLAGGIAHDFNNLLTGIIGYADLLRVILEDPQEVGKAADMIRGAASRAAQLTDKLLGFARKGKNQNVPVDIHSSIQEALRLLERTVEREIVFCEQLNAPSASVRGDPVQIEQVILNLIINARDAILSASHGATGSRITIMTGTHELAASECFDSLIPGHYFKMSIADSGCGIPPDIRDRIFEPFFTTKESGKGTGMGLAMVYGIVKNHGGGIQVESEVGKGTTFHVYLPLCRELPVSRTINSSLDAIPGKGTILIVDDHSVIRDVTREMLLTLGYEVSVVEDGVEAIKFYEAYPERCNAIILDMVMPRMGARECIHELQRINPEVKIILSTGYERNEAVQELLNQGLVGFIQKPYQLNRLSEIVAEAMAREHIVSLGMNTPVAQIHQC